MISMHKTLCEIWIEIKHKTIVYINRSKGKTEFVCHMESILSLAMVYLKKGAERKIHWFLKCWCAYSLRAYSTVLFTSSLSIEHVIWNRIFSLSFSWFLCLLYFSNCDYNLCEDDYFESQFWWCALFYEVFFSFNRMIWLTHTHYRCWSGKAAA